MNQYVHPLLYLIDIEGGGRLEGGHEGGRGGGGAIKPKPQTEGGYEGAGRQPKL